MADSTLAGLANTRYPILTDLLYTTDSGGAADYKEPHSNALALLDSFGGRLTTETSVPVSTSDRTAQGTIYLTPSQGLGSGIYRLYDGTGWRIFSQFTDFSLALTVTSGKNYDWFLRWNAGTPILALSSAWTNDTTRADALALQNGIPVLSSDHTYRHGGAIRASGSNVTEDSDLKRFCVNDYNLMPRRLFQTNTADSHAYATNAYRQYNNGTNGPFQVEALIAGAGLNVVHLSLASIVGSDGVAVWRVDMGIGIDTTTAVDNSTRTITAGPNADTLGQNIQSAAGGALDYGSLGYHYFSCNESSVGGVNAEIYGFTLDGHIWA